MAKNWRRLAGGHAGDTALVGQAEARGESPGAASASSMRRFLTCWWAVRQTRRGREQSTIPEPAVGSMTDGPGPRRQGWARPSGSCAGWPERRPSSAAWPWPWYTMRAGRCVGRSRIAYELSERTKGLAHGGMGVVARLLADVGLPEESTPRWSSWPQHRPGGRDQAMLNAI